MYVIDIKEFRRANKMTQRELAEYFGIKVQGYISQMESGERPVPEKYICKILADKTKDSSMVKVIDPDDEVRIPREVFDKLSQLMETVSSQQGTISEQQRMIAGMFQKIENLTTSVELDARAEDDAGCAAVK